MKNSQYTFLQQRNPGKDTWNTGYFNKKLKIISKDDRSKFGLALSTRASIVLHNLQAKNGGLEAHLGRQQPKFYTMAEDLPHHVRAMKAVASSGVPHSFFDNVFVHGCLEKLQPLHRAVYRRTFLRLLCVCVDCQNKEVGVFYVLDDIF